MLSLCISIASYQDLTLYLPFVIPVSPIKSSKKPKKIRYENSILEHVDVKKVMIRLEELMEEDKLFMDDELSLSRLSIFTKNFLLINFLE